MGRTIRSLAFLGVMLAARAALAVDYNPVSFGAVGDTKFERDCSTTNGSGIVTCPSAGWVNGDVGKVMWCVNLGLGTANPLIAVTTIASRQSASQVTTTAHANDTVNGSAQCAWGTQDDTAGIQAAVAAASSTTVQGITFLTPPGRVLFPCGGFQVSGRILNVLATNTTIPQFVGGGNGCTMLVLRPDMSTIPGDGTGALVQTTGDGIIFKDIGIEGLDMPFSWNVDQDLIRVTQATGVVFQNFNITNLAGTGGGSASALSFRDVSRGMVDNVLIQGSPANGFPIFAMKFVSVGNVTIQNSLISNFDDNLYVGASHGRTPTTVGITWVGGLIDECFLAGGCLQLHDAEMSIIGATVYGNQASPPITVDGTSRLWATDLSVTAFNAIGAVNPISIASGGVVVSRGTTWSTNGTGKIANSGTFVDGGGNNYHNCSGTTCTPKSASQSFSGNLPVTTWPNNLLAPAPPGVETQSSSPMLPLVLVGVLILLLIVLVFRRRPA